MLAHGEEFLAAAVEHAHAQDAVGVAAIVDDGVEGGFHGREILLEQADIDAVLEQLVQRLQLVGQLFVDLPVHKPQAVADQQAEHDRFHQQDQDHETKAQRFPDHLEHLGKPWISIRKCA